LCVSDDYGSSFIELSDRVFYAVESRTEDSLMFGVMHQTYALASSNDGGSHGRC